MSNYSVDYDLEGVTLTEVEFETVQKFCRRVGRYIAHNLDSDATEEDVEYFLDHEIYQHPDSDIRQVLRACVKVVEHE